ncbi:HNH endonuclease [Rathayibacter caricis]|uniref:HNH endonuclease signature motif containing protein n=1 Tax=Rathayibacter caricis TaxID=110936 RepID=UPI001FB37A85|nr:HNH endonuclease signature motif containing protein [Rathayibacter caricis]MCJ1695534.1 HNH endonuclease [Rathayibacter caricis]
MVLLDVEARPAGGGPSVRECFDDALVAAVGAACAVDAFRARAEAERAELIELARRTAMTLPDALVDSSVQAHVEREEAAMRALVAEIATGMRISESLAGILVEESRMLVNELPETLTALREAAIAPEHARVIIRAALDLPVDVRGRFDDAAAALARDCTPPQLRRRLRSLRERLHPESLTDRHTRCAARRGVWLDGDLDGMATLRLHLPAPEAHGAFDRIDRSARSLHENPYEERTLGQLRADVAAALLLDGETVPSSDASQPMTAILRGIRPQVSVTVPVLTLLGHSDEPGILDGYGPIDPATARRLAADAPSFTRILTHPETGAVLSVGRTTYRVPADLRRALAHRDITCRFPGCTRSARDSDIDHSIEWQHHGPTDADNLAHLCRHHHRLRHTTTWQVRHRPDGVLEWTSPTGRHHTTAPEPPEPPERLFGGASEWRRDGDPPPF